MLYSPTGVSRPYRIQGTWVTDEERESIVEFVKRSGTAQYSQEIINEIDLASQDKKAQQPVQAAEVLIEPYEGGEGYWAEISENDGIYSFVLPRSQNLRRDWQYYRYRWF